MRWLLLGLVVLVGCVMPDVPREASDDPPQGKGLLVLSVGSGRSLLGSSWASDHADAYELILMNESTSWSVDVVPGVPQAIAVDPGTWSLLLLVGTKRSSGSSTAYLAASGLAEGVVIVEGHRTPVSLTLKSIDLQLDAGPAVWTQTVTVHVAGKTRNPRLGMLLSGASTTQRPRFKSVELWNGYREMAAVSGVPDDWSADATGTVPVGASTVSVALVGAGLCVWDGANRWTPTAGLTKGTWMWVNRADLADSHPFTPLAELILDAQPPPTGLDVSVTWE